MSAFQGIAGLIVFTALAWAISERRSALRWQTVAAGLGGQALVAVILLKLPGAQSLFSWLNDGVVALQAATESGATFVFGYLGGGPQPFEETQPGASLILAFRALPLVIVISALTALLNYWRVLPVIVRALSAALERGFRIGGAVALSAAANVFVGMVEAPLFVRTWLARLDRGELFMVMCTGMATIAGTMLVLYATILESILPDAIGHLLTASLMSAPAALMVAALMVPAGRRTGGEVDAPTDRASSAMDAITRGTRSGLELYLHIIAMLLVLVALVYLANAILGLLPDIGGGPVTLERMLGILMMPVVWCMGVPWSEAGAAGSLMGIKTVLNEFIAYARMAALPSGTLSAQSALIMSYALCGFANFGSLGIMIGGLTTLVPERREEIIGLGLKSIVGGTLATCLTGSIAGLIA